MSASLVVNEIYLSLQGESTFAVLPCIFIRLTGCNLRCSYCDTAYAFHEGTKRTVEDVVAAPDVPNIYELPRVLREEHLDDRVLQRLNIWAGQPHLEKWEEYCARARNPHHQVRIAIVGNKAFSQGELTDAIESREQRWWRFFVRAVRSTGLARKSGNWSPGARCISPTDSRHPAFRPNASY